MAQEVGKGLGRGEILLEALPGRGMTDGFGLRKISPPNCAI
tara:strand:- start:321 stop:443 length:123 start_codon:yes stop_codon:yes gene_type:complete